MLTILVFMVHRTMNNVDYSGTHGTLILTSSSGNKKKTPDISESLYTGHAVLSSDTSC